MSGQGFHHALLVLSERCKGCTHCMKRCPTMAIRITAGKAVIDERRCIDCAQCMEVCPNQAIVVEQDPFSQLEAFQVKVAIVPAAFFAQFGEGIEESQIIAALHDCNFTHLYLAETGIDILDILQAGEIPTSLPLISNFCPASQRLVQIRFPLLLDNLSLLRPPAQVTALFARSELENQNTSVGIFYFTPCAAKIAQFKTEGSEEHRLFDGIINFDSAYNQVSSLLSKRKKEYQGRHAELTFPSFTRKAYRWSLVKGQIANHPNVRSLAIDEMHNVIEFLEILEEEEESTLEFLELQACAEGCVGGILTVRNRFLASERIRHNSRLLPKQLSEESCNRILRQAERLKGNLYLTQPLHHSSLSLDEDRTKALHILEKIENIYAVLPHIDCGLCGSPSCRALAEDIAKSQASIRQCVVLKLKDPNQLNSLARIWGERPTAAGGRQDDPE